MKIKKKKLLFFISSMRSGGAERVMAILTNELAKRSHSIILVIMTEDESFYDINPAIKVVNFPFKNEKSLFGKIKNRIKMYSFIRKVCKRERPNVIVSFIYQMNTDVLLSTRFLKIPVIVSEHNTLDRKMSFFEKIHRLYISRLADKLTVLTEHDFNFLGRRLKNKVVMANPLSFEPLHEYKEEREKVILAVGSIDRYKHKGFDNLIEVWSHIADKYPDWQLQVAGGGRKESLGYLKAIEETMGIKNKIQFIGQVKNMEEILKRASIFILSSRWEGLPMVLMEAMSQGCTCISYDLISGPNEIITHDFDGILIENQNKEKMIEGLSNLIEDHRKRRFLANNAICSIEKFSIKGIVNRWESLFDQVS